MGEPFDFPTDISGFPMLMVSSPESYIVALPVWKAFTLTRNKSYTSNTKIYKFVLILPSVSYYLRSFTVNLFPSILLLILH